MAVEKDLKEAMDRLRKHQNHIGRRHNRFHIESMEETVYRMRALEGICGQCDNLLLLQTRDSIGKKTVKLICHAGHSPIDLYRTTDLGKVPFCPDR